MAHSQGAAVLQTMSKWRLDAEALQEHFLPPSVNSVTSLDTVASMPADAQERDRAFRSQFAQLLCPQTALTAGIRSDSDPKTLAGCDAVIRDGQDRSHASRK